MDGNRSWLLPLIGVLFIIVLIVSFALGGEPPDPDEGVEEVVDFYKDNQDSVQVGAVLQGLAGALFIFWGGALRKFFRPAEGEGGGASLVAFAGTVVFAIAVAIDGTINFAAAETIDDIDPTATQALHALWSNDFVPLAMGVLVFLVGIGVTIVRTGLVPKWLGWVAIVLAVFGLTPLWFVPFIGAALLVLTLSILLALRARGGAAPART